MRFVIVSGRSGAGKTTALQALEEFGYFVCDNLPPMLWTALLTNCRAQKLEQVAVVTDARTRYFLADLEMAFAVVQTTVQPELVFLDADDDVLVRRYGLTRRQHPLGEPTLLGDLREERRVLAGLREKADAVIDTSNLKAKDLVERLRVLFAASSQQFILTLFSFGYKHGAPTDADLVVDARSLPNPFWDQSLKERSGLEPDVAKHIFTADGTAFYNEMRDFIRLNVVRAKTAKRGNYSVAVGCTGGFHRSVAVIEALSRDFSEFTLQTEHRDLVRGEGGV
ncbi:MAG: RNase adapter RapZ [Deinococcales bacterium]